MVVPVKIRFRSGTSAEWERSNPVLSRGEPAYDTTLRIIKVGTGFTRWASLPALATKESVSAAISEAIATIPASGSGGGGEMSWGTKPPAAPSSLGGSVVTVLSPDGTPRNAVTLTTTPVTKNADGSTPTNPITSYEFRWKTAKGTRSTMPTTIGPGGSPYGYLNALFDRRGRGGFGWVSGDGALSARRSDGKDHWTFGDSMIGALKPDGTPDPSVWYGIINNCLVTTDPNSLSEMKSYFGRGNLLHTGVACTTGTIANFFTPSQSTISFSTEFRGPGSTTSLKIVTSGTSAHTSASTASTPGGQPNAVFPVVAGQKYTIQGLIKAGTTARACNIFLQCYNDSDTSVGQALPAQVTDSTTGVTLNQTVTIPAGATKAMLRCIVYHPTGTAAGEAHYFTNLAVIPGEQTHQSWAIPRNREYDGIIRPEGLAGFIPEAGRTPNDYFIWPGATWVNGGKIYVAQMLLKWETPGVAGGGYGDTGETWIAQWDEATMAYEGSKKVEGGTQTVYADHAFVEGSYVYLVGHRTNTAGGFMMRLPLATPMTSAPTFWNGTGWGAASSAATVVIPKDSSSMHKIGSVYHAYRIDPFDRHIKEMTSTSLTSGWVDRTTSLYQMPEHGGDSIYTYLPRVHPQFDSPDGRVFGYSQNNSNWSATDGTPRFAIGPAGPQSAPNFSPVAWSGRDYANSPSTIVPEVPSDSYFYAETRSVDQSGNISTDSDGTVERWTPIGSPIYIPRINTVPATPDAPLVWTRFEDAQITASGLTDTGRAYPDGTKIEVHYSRQPGFVPTDRTVIDTLPSTGGQTYLGVASDATRYACLVAVSPDGVRSSPSGMVTVKTPNNFSVGINRRINFGNPGDENFHFIRAALKSEWGFFPYDNLQIMGSEAIILRIFDGEQMNIVKGQGINAKVPINMGGNAINLRESGDNSSIRYLSKTDWGFFPYDHNYYVAPEGHRWGITGKDIFKITPKVAQFEWIPLGLTQVTTATRPDGSGLKPGAMVFDTTVGGVIVWNGTAWTQIGSGGGGGTATSVAWADVTGKPSTFAPTIGTTSTTAKAGNYAPAWSEVTGKPTTFAPAAHTHAIADVTNLQSALDGKAPNSHTHAAADLTGVVKTINNTPPDENGNVAVAGGGGGGTTSAWADITGKPATFPPETHTHTAAQISDATTVGRNVLKAADAAAARTAIGAGTSSLAIGTTSTTAAAGDHTHTAANISDSTSTGRSLMTAASAEAARTAIGAADLTAVGGTDTDYVSTFESRLA